MADERRIEWEDYKANYIDNNIPDPDDEFDDSKFDDEDDEDDDDSPPQGGIDKILGMVSFPFGGPIGGGQVINTPWGGFSNANKLAPHNFYDIKLGHFKGFSTFSNKNFTDIMDNIDGVAIWKALDPYCIAVGKARLYTWAEVTANIKNALLGNQKNDEPDDKILSIRDKIIAENSQNHIEYYVAAIFPNGEVIQITPDQDDYTDKLKQINELKNKLSLVIIENGVVKC